MREIRDIRNENTLRKKLNGVLLGDHVGIYRRRIALLNSPNPYSPDFDAQIIEWQRTEWRARVQYSIFLLYWSFFATNGLEETVCEYLYTRMGLGKTALPLDFSREERRLNTKCRGSRPLTLSDEVLDLKLVNTVYCEFLKSSGLMGKAWEHFRNRIDELPPNLIDDVMNDSCYPKDPWNSDDDPMCPDEPCYSGASWCSDHLLY